ncbi:MAG: histone deacetylase family protein [Colwellia sp.]
MTVGIIGHYKCGDHNMGDHHPENAKRLTAINDQLIRSGLDYVVRQFDATPIDEKWLNLAHSEAYIKHIFDNAPQTGSFQLDDDTSMMPSTLPAALLSAGAAIDAVDLVMEGTLKSAFCATRPPGHHAEHDKAMGFCFFNNVALAAEYAKNVYKVKRIAILDFDVHHGNGTEDIILNKVATPSDYLFCSTYQYPFYPFEMKESNTPPIINTPLDATTKSEGFKKAITENWLPAIQAFKPELIFISAGFDAHSEDEMSQISLVDSDYRWITDEIKKLADEHCQGRIISVLEGGYAHSALGRSVVAHINGLIGN